MGTKEILLGCVLALVGFGVMWLGEAMQRPVPPGVPQPFQNLFAKGLWYLGLGLVFIGLMPAACFGMWMNSPVAF